METYLIGKSKWLPYRISLYSCSPSPGSDVSTETQLLSECTHSLFLRAREPVCAVSLGARDLALHLANTELTPLPEDGEQEYRNGKP